MNKTIMIWVRKARKEVAQGNTLGRAVPQRRKLTLTDI